MFKDISSFLSRFSNFTLPDQYIKDAVVFSIQKSVGIQLHAGNIEIKGTTVQINAHPPALKNEILIHKSEILSYLESVSKKRQIRDLR